MGLGHDPTDDLKSSSLMFNAKPTGEESLDFIIGQDFRQVGLLKNPKVDSSGNTFRQLAVQGRHYSADSDSGGGTLFTASTGRAVRGLQLASLSNNFTEDKTKTFGRSKYMTSVIFDGITSDIGKIVQVKIHKSNRTTLFGEIVNNSNQKVA